MDNKLYLIKFTDSQIKGPYTSAQVFDLIYEAILNGKELICEYPSGQWIEIGKEKKFFDAFLGQINIDKNNTVVNQETAYFKQSSNFEDKNLRSENDATLIFDNKNNIIKNKDSYTQEEVSPLIPEAILAIEKRKETLKKQNNLSAFKNLITISIISVLAYYAYFYYTNKNTNIDKDTINIDRYKLTKNYMQIKLPSVDSEFYNPELSKKTTNDALNLILNDNIESYKKASELLFDALIYDTDNANALSLLAVSYARLFNVSKQDTEYINALNSLIQRAEKKDTNIQNISQAQILEKINLKDYKSALSIFDSVSYYIQTIDPSLLLIIAEVYFLKNDLNTAFKALNSLSQHENINLPRVYYLLGLINLINNQNSMAEANFNKALKINPKHSESEIELILLGVKNQKNTEILNYIDKNINNLSFQGISKLLYIVAKNQYITGKLKLAKQISEIALSFDNTNLLLKTLYEELGGDLNKFPSKVSSFSNYDLEQFEKFMIRGDYLFASQEFRDAILQYKMAASIKPKEILVWHKLGETYRKTYEYDKAIDAYNKVLEINKLYLPSLTKLARTYINVYNLNAAAENIKTARSIDPENPEVLFTLAYLYDTHGKYYEALKHYHEALVNDFSQVDAVFEIGRKYFLNKEYENAKLQFNKVISVQPNFYDAYVFLIQISSIIDHEYQFKKYIDELSRLFPNIAEINTAYAISLIEKQNIQEAQAQLDIASKKNKYSILTLSVKADLSKMLGNFKEAVKYLNTISIIAPYYFPAIMMRIQIFQELGDFENKEKELLYLSKLTPYYPNVFYQLAEIYYYSGKTESAITSLINQIEFQPNNFNAYTFLGELYLDQGKTQEAITLYRKLLSSNPKNPYGLFGMALASYYSQDYNTALTFIQQTKLIDSNINEIYLLECKIFDKLNSINEAIDRCSEFIRYAPNHYRVNEARELLRSLQRR